MLLQQYTPRYLCLEYDIFEFTNFASQEVFVGVSLKVILQPDDAMDVTEQDFS